MESFVGGTGSLGMGIVFELHDKFSATSDKIGAKFKELASTTEIAVKQMQAAIAGLKLGLMSLAVGAIILLPFIHAVKEAAEFNKEMSKVYAYTRANTEQMVALKKAALDLSLVSMFNATDIAKGMTTMGGLGLSVTQTLKAIPLIANYATAAQADFNASAEIGINTMHLFGKGVGALPDIYDKMAVSSTHAGVSLEAMKTSMTYIGGVASAMSMSITDSMALMDVMNLKGALNPGIASLSRSLETLADKKAQKEMAKLGISLTDNKGNFIGMGKAIDIVNTAMLKFGKEGTQGLAKVGEVQKLFNTRGGAGFLKLMQSMVTVNKDGKEVVMSGADALKYMTAQLNNSEGAAKRLADQMMDNLAGAVTIMKSSLQTMWVNMGDSFDKPLQKVVEGLTKIINLVSEFFTTRLGHAVAYLLVGLGLLLVSFGALKTIMSLVKMAGAQLAIIFDTLKLSEIGAAFATGGLSAGFATLGTVVWTALAPLLPFIAILAAIAAPFIFLYKAYKSFTAAIEDNKKISTGWLGIFQRIGGVIAGVMEIFSTWDGKQATMSRGMIDTLKKMGIYDLVLNIGTWVIRLKEIFFGFMEGAREVWHVFKDILNWIGDKISWVADALSSLGINMEANKNKLDAWRTVGKAIAIVLGVIVGLLAAMAIAFIVVNAVSIAWVLLIAGALYLAWQLLVNIFDAIDDIVKGFEKWSESWSFFKGWGDIFENFGNMIGEFIDGNFLRGNDFMDKFMDGIKAKIPSFEQLLQGILDTLNPLDWFDSAPGTGGVDDYMKTHPLHLQAHQPQAPTPQLAPIMASNAARGGNTYYNNTTNHHANPAQPIIHNHFYVDGEEVSNSMSNRSRVENNRH